jgi:hypothetical protein
LTILRSSHVEGLKRLLGCGAELTGNGSSSLLYQSMWSAYGSTDSSGVRPFWMLSSTRSSSRDRTSSSSLYGSYSVRSAALGSSLRLSRVSSISPDSPRRCSFCPSLHAHPQQHESVPAAESHLMGTFCNFSAHTCRSRCAPLARTTRGARCPLCCAVASHPQKIRSPRLP